MKSSDRQLADLATELLRAAGMSANDARDTTAAMLWANARGIPAHGIGGKLPQCLDRIRDGGTKANPSIAVIRDLGAAVSLDADGAWGQVAGSRGMRLAIERATTLGVGLVSVHNTNSAAAMGYYSWLAADSGMVGLAITNGPPLVAAPTGRQPLVSNQGHSIGCPGPQGRHLIHDSALTTMSTGTMEGYHQRGEPLPMGVLRDSAGEPTTDPSQWPTGLLEPIGGHRGFSLAVALEVLTGILGAGQHFATEVGLPGCSTVPQGVSLFLLAANPELTGGRDRIVERITDLRERAATLDVASGGRLPGDHGNVSAAVAQPITLTADQRNSLHAHAQALGVRAAWLAAGQAAR